jgi:hypothetical protein
MDFMDIHAHRDKKVVFISFALLQPVGATAFHSQCKHCSLEVVNPISISLLCSYNSLLRSATPRRVPEVAANKQPGISRWTPICTLLVHDPRPASCRGIILPLSLSSNMSFNPHSVLYNQSDFWKFFQYSQSSNGTTLTCSICSVNVVASSWLNHVHENGHLENSRRLAAYRVLEDDFSGRRKAVDTILPMLSDLGLARWRDDLRLQLFAYVMDRNVVDTT